MQSQENIAVLIAVGCLAMLVLVIAIIMFVAIYQRKILLKEAKIKLIESEKQIDLFKASVQAEEQQKEKIARNLHDEINPLLSVLKLNLSRHRIQAQKNTFDPDSLKADSEIIDKAIEGIRTTCMDLIPSFLFEFGFLKSIEDYIYTHKQHENYSVEIENTTQPEDINVFDKQAQLAIYRVCLELLNNIFKHSACKHFKMSVQKNDEALVLEFSHDGKGFTNEDIEVYTEKSKGLGLKSLKARALILNAKIDYLLSQNKASVKLIIPNPL